MAKKDEPTTSESPKHSHKGYSTPQGLNKSIKRLGTALPKSPSKACQTIQGLALRHGIALEAKMDRQIRPNRVVDEDTIRLVREFYLKSDVVYTMPDMKDQMTVWSEGKKEKLNKHYLVMYLKEVYSLFKLTYPNVKIGFSKFASLKPVHVLVLKHTPEDQCKCKVHENLKLKLNALRYEYISSEFWLKNLCEGAMYDSDCWKGVCEVCKGGCLFKEGVKDEIDFSETVAWKMWEKEESSGRVHIVVHETCVGELLDLLFEGWGAFQEHVRIKHIQANAFQTDKEDPNVTVCQCDFAMAYSCSYQNEIQSAL